VSDNEQPDVEAFRELAALVYAIGDELAGFRRRALQAENRIKTLEASVGPDAPSLDRVRELERENAELRARLEVATERTKHILDRVRFLRQQSAAGGA
jgi:hypothetical protein